MKQFVILKEGKKKWLYQNSFLMKEKLFQLVSHPLLRTRNLVKYLWEKSKISLITSKNNNHMELTNEHITGKNKNLDCFKHLNDHFDHEFWWGFLSRASKNCLKRKILEAYYIKTCQPSLNKQINSDILNLFRNANIEM